MTKNTPLQNWWQLTAIQTATLGMVELVSSPKLALAYGAGTAALSSLIAGLLLWLVGFTIVSMAYEHKSNAIENASAFIGNFGGGLAAIVSIAGFPIWFIYQLYESAKMSHSTALSEETLLSLQVILGIFLGVVSALIATKNLLEILKKSSLAILPVLIALSLAIVYFSKASPDFSTMVISVECISAYIALSFAGMVNLPTFFQHSRSKYDAYLALTAMTLIVFFFQVITIMLCDNISDPFAIFGSFGSDYPILNSIQSFVIVAFLSLLCVNSNLSNLYFAYPSVKFLFSKFKMKHSLCILALINTAIFCATLIFPAAYERLLIGNKVADDFIANLGCALILIFFIREIVKHRPTPLEKLISTVSWIAGCIGTIYAHAYMVGNPLTFGINITVVAYLIAFFIEEPFWSAIELRKLLKKNNEKANTPTD